MKLVICYSTGEYDSHVNYNICFECESKDEFLEKFTESVNVHLKYKEKQKELNLNVFEARKSKIPAKNSIANKEIRDFFEKYSKFLFNLIIDNCEFPVPDNDIVAYKLINLQDVYTLDEWFDENKAKESFTSI